MKHGDLQYHLSNLIVHKSFYHANATSVKNRTMHGFMIILSREGQELCERLKWKRAWQFLLYVLGSQKAFFFEDKC